MTLTLKSISLPLFFFFLYWLLLFFFPCVSPFLFLFFLSNYPCSFFFLRLSNSIAPDHNHSSIGCPDHDCRRYSRERERDKLTMIGDQTWRTRPNYQLGPNATEIPANHNSCSLTAINPQLQYALVSNCSGHPLSSAGPPLFSLNSLLSPRAHL